MTNYREVELCPEGRSFVFTIGREEYGATHPAEAQQIIDEVIAESFAYRGIVCWPEGDNDLGFTVGGNDYRIGLDTPRPALEAAIRAIIDGVLGQAN